MLQNPKITYKNNIKNNKESPAAARRDNDEFNALKEAIREKFSRFEKPSKIQLALNECRAADLHPLDLIGAATHNWFGFVHAACATPDVYRDRIRTYAVFVEEVRPANATAMALVERVASAYA